MVNNINFKQDLEDFIRDRIEESYKIVSNKKEYKEQYQKFKELETNFIKKRRVKARKIQEKLNERPLRTVGTDSRHRRTPA